MCLWTHHSSVAGSAFRSVTSSKIFIIYSHQSCGSEMESFFTSYSLKISLITFLPHHVHVIVLMVSGLTIFIIAGLVANFEFGLNRIIALSTLRHLLFLLVFLVWLFSIY